jgi:threonine synthase
LFSGYLLDPHTAVAKTVGDRVEQEDRPMVILIKISNKM